MQIFRGSKLRYLVNWHNEEIYNTCPTIVIENTLGEFNPLLAFFRGIHTTRPSTHTALADSSNRTIINSALTRCACEDTLSKRNEEKQLRDKI